MRFYENEETTLYPVSGYGLHDVPLGGGQTALAASMPSTYTKDGVTYNYSHASGLMGIYYNTDKQGYALVTYSNNTYATVKSSVTGTYTGDRNIVSGDSSSVSGGDLNTASGESSSVSGGYQNTASGRGSSVSGGENNTASGMQSSVSGGTANVASSYESSVSGGQHNTASGQESSVSGGQHNTASGIWSSISGGRYNTASGYISSVSGGYGNTASGQYSSAFGGKDSVVQGQYSTGVAGGSTGSSAENSIAAGYRSVVTVAFGTAVGYQATTNQTGTIAFGHDSGDVSGYTVTWQKDSNGNTDYTKDPTITENKYTSAYYNRLVKVADGQSAHDVATVGQTATLGSTNGSVKITKSTNTNGSTNYDLAIDKITVNADGVIASGNTGILSGGTAYNYLQNAVFYDASAKDLLTFKGASGTRLTNLKDATLSATSTDAVTGRQLYTTNQNMAGFADQITKNASKLEALSTSVTNSLDSVSAMSESVSTIDNTKADASLNNLSDAGKEVISAAATEAVQAYMKNLNGGSAKSTLKTLSAKRYTASPSSLLTTSFLALPATDAPSDLSGKADVSYVEEGLSTKADKGTVYTKEETDTKLTGKADTDLKNLSDAGKGVIKDVMKDDLAKKADKTAVAEALTKKADADASNIDAAAYAKKLGTGTVTSGNADLVTGGTVYTALSKSGIGLVQSDGQTMTVGAKDNASVVDFHNASGSGRVLTGVTTNAADRTSAANVGYVNSVANSMAQDFTSQIQQTSSMLTRDINKVGAGAAALAGLHPGEYDPADKWDFAAGYGHYKGANASAFGAYYHPNEDTLVSLSGTIGNGDPMLSAGVTFKLGSGVSPHTMSRTALTKELNAVQQQNQVLTAQNQAIAQQMAAVDQKNQQLEKDMADLKEKLIALMAAKA